jgi:hypothetical protein
MTENSKSQHSLLVKSGQLDTEKHQAQGTGDLRAGTLRQAFNHGLNMQKPSKKRSNKN